MSRSLRSAGWLAWMLVAILASAAGAQAPVYAAGVGASADTVTIDGTLARAVESASARGLPAQPLLAKIREGRLKRAATPRIRTALAALVTRLDSARAALGPAASADELIAGADALAAGADANAVRAVRAASLGRPASAPLGALAQLVASGVPGPRAVVMVVELLRKNASSAQVLAFGNLVESDVVSGLPAEEAAQLRLHSFGTAGSQTLQSADAPSVPGSTTGSFQGSTQSPPSKTPRRRP
jgi:hypothetical protein